VEAYVVLNKTRFRDDPLVEQHIGGRRAGYRGAAQRPNAGRENAPQAQPCFARKPLRLVPER
jgi:hypothetical protein